MEDSSGKKAGGKNAAKKNKENRGTKDELESLALIVTTVPSVRTQVMTRLKDAKERALKNREQQLRKAQ